MGSRAWLRWCRDGTNPSSSEQAEQVITHGRSSDRTSVSWKMIGADVDNFGVRRSTCLFHRPAACSILCVKPANVCECVGQPPLLVSLT